ncbi:primosomal replication protein PriC [Salinivibrio costicola]|uniref:primosomal replication protein PriC n=1 Tax=Salinivibrio costicola TaxID=51367 RepID=UPI0003959514|nr:primosomal replication protein [Salinivibrio costicola]
MKAQIDAMSQHLEQLANQAAEVDRRRGEARAPLFATTLFHCKGKLLTPCVNEAQGLLAVMQRDHQQGVLTDARATHICDTLLSQITALQRELATQPLRKQEQAKLGPRRQAIGELYQDLAKHQDWERRLADKLRDANASVEMASTPAVRQQYQKQVLALEQRLARCTKARERIETTISYREKKS